MADPERSVRAIEYIVLVLSRSLSTRTVGDERCERREPATLRAKPVFIHAPMVRGLIRIKPRSTIEQIIADLGADRDAMGGAA